MGPDDGDGRQGFDRVLQPRSQHELQVLRYLKRIRTAAHWDARTQTMVSARPYEGVIRVGSGHELKQADMFDGSDPYCEVFWSDERVGTTRCIEDSLNPAWNECFRILVEPARMNTLRVKLFDHDDEAFDDDPDFLGEAVLSGVGADALPRAMTDVPLQKEQGPARVIHTANHSYVEDQSVSGRVEVQYVPMKKLAAEQARRDQILARAERKAKARRAARRGGLRTPSLGGAGESGGGGGGGGRWGSRQQLLPPPSPASVAQKSAVLGVTTQTHRSKALDLSFRGIVSLVNERRKMPARPDAPEPHTFEDAVAEAGLREWAAEGWQVPPGPSAGWSAVRAGDEEGSGWGAQPPPQHGGRLSSTSLPSLGGAGRGRRSHGSSGGRVGGRRAGGVLAVTDQVKLAHNKLQSLAGVGEALRPYLWRHQLATVSSLDLSSNLLRQVSVPPPQRQPPMEDIRKSY